MAQAYVAVRRLLHNGEHVAHMVEHGGKTALYNRQGPIEDYHLLQADRVLEAAQASGIYPPGYNSGEPGVIRVGTETDLGRFLHGWGCFEDVPAEGWEV